MSIGSWQLIYLPSLHWQIMFLLALLILILLMIALFTNANGAWLRALAGFILLLTLANPQLEHSEREALSDIVLLLVDKSLSQSIENRSDQTDKVVSSLVSQVKTLAKQEISEPLELKVISIDDDNDSGTNLLQPLQRAATEMAPDRIAAAILLTDGQVADAEYEPIRDFAAPIHAIITGRDNEYDRRLILDIEPNFGIVGDELDISLHIEEIGIRPLELDSYSKISLFLNGNLIEEKTVNLGESFTLSPKIAKRGPNQIEIHMAPVEEEITDVNNFASFSVTGVRERLLVLLVSGEPNSGGRVWRNMLKSDPAVDLVHFSILRPPSKFTATPLSAISLIPFPTEELFVERLHDFDLIIFDRYRRRGILQTFYLENVVDYVHDGGAVLISAGPEFAGVDSLWHSPIAGILPATPSGRVFEQPFLPHLSKSGERHPITAELTGANWQESDPKWGKWLRQIEFVETSGTNLMLGIQDSPLMIIDRVGQGRVAMIGSDHFWLWTRLYDGGGPSIEVLRRTAHWLMKEPDLEEEALTARSEDRLLIVERRSISQSFSKAIAETPSGRYVTSDFELISPGLWRANFEIEEIGVYHIFDGESAKAKRTRFVAGPSSPEEYANPVSTVEKLKPIIEAKGGAIVRYDNYGVPKLRRVHEGATAHGLLLDRDPWIGMNRRQAYMRKNPTLVSPLPAWIALAITLAAILLAWKREGS